MSARKHGLTKTRVYRVWDSMKQRCYNPKNKKYKNYGARGITVCDEWLHDAEAFAKWAYENGFDDTKSQREQSIDRIDVNKGYCPENCRFVDTVVQANNKTNNVFITFDGKTQTIPDWSRETGIGAETIYFRIKHGWGAERTLTQPVRECKKMHERNYLIEYSGQKRTLSEWSKITGLPYTTLRCRLDRYGWTVEDALTTPIKEIEIEFNGIKDSKTGWARRLGIKPKTLAYRFEHGWSVEKALTTPVKEYKETQAV